MSHHHFHKRAPVAGTAAGAYLRQFRQQAGLSQLNLSLITGISQRHLSCIETGRAKASPGTLHALLSALDVPLEQCNEVFLASGYAPRYSVSPINAPQMEAVYGAINHILQANNPAPAIVINSLWDITAANVSTGLLFDLVGVAHGQRSGVNLLRTLLCPGGLGDYLINAQEIRVIAWQRATREAASNADLSQVLRDIPPPASLCAEAELSPVVLTRLNSRQGELAFLSTFTTFGMPLDSTVQSLRIEHLIPADTQTWKIMTAAYEQWPGDS